MSPSFVRVCRLQDILPGTGVCALVAGKQVAIFRPYPHEQLYALDNFDPFSKANVLSRGILGSAAGRPKVASPIYKQAFDLETGTCLDDPHVTINTYPVRVQGGEVFAAA